MQLALRELKISFPRRPLLMGIVNINDDSFSGDGTLALDQALEIAVRQVAAGADIIDVGGESARTNREPIGAEEEVARVTPFIEHLPAHLAACGCQARDTTQIFPPLVSLNSWRTEVIRQLLPLPVDILNDMSALPVADNAELAAKYRAALLIMHSVGSPKVDHSTTSYVNIMRTLEEFFANRLALCKSAGLPETATILDPGLDFAKQRSDNLQLLRQLDTLHQFHRPILLPVSRKGFIGDVLGLAVPAARDAGTQALVEHGMALGASIFRVHNVAAAYQTVKVLTALQQAT